MANLEISLLFESLTRLSTPGLIHLLRERAFRLELACSVWGCDANRSVLSVCRQPRLAANLSDFGNWFRSPPRRYLL